MARMRHSFETALTRLAVAVANCLSAKGADRFAAGLGSFAFHLVRSRRKIADDNLKQAFGDRYTGKERAAIVKAVFQNVARTFVELARLRQYDRATAGELFEVEGVDPFQQSHPEGQGRVAVTAHFGCWELSGGWLALHEDPVAALVLPQHNRAVNDLVNNLRLRMGLDLIPVEGTAVRAVFKALKAGYIVVVVADQHAPAQSLILDFFGRKAAVAKGPALFAVRSGCPLIPYLMRRDRYDRHVIMSGEPIYPPNSGDEEQDIEIMTRSYLGFFESLIEKYPEQWMWTHRRWKL
ncbi:MAG: lysophospholipid acyltransferase family protein [Candidatus Zixiibacteriota bacterium]|nr:MAG: lysophospholipid acyltransferase family protein [candidate division Zixibacteria bacterium]